MYSTLIVSFPKSGRTWLRYMIGSLVRGLDGGGHDDGANGMMDEGLDLGARFGLTFSHLGAVHSCPRDHVDDALREFSPSGAPRTGVLLARNAYSTLTSYYYHARFRQRDRPFESACVDEFLASERFGLPRLIAFYRAWSRAWAPALGCAHVLWYDDMLQDPVAGLERVAELAGIEADRSSVERAVEDASFERMKRASLAAEAPDHLKPRDVEDPRTFKVRRADPLEYRSFFNADQLALIAGSLRNDPIISASGALAGLWAEPRVPAGA